MSECYACERNADAVLPPRECAAKLGIWRAAHAFNSTLPGWMVLVPDRHVDSIAELSADESADLGRLIHGVSAALVSELGALKSYVMLFAEAPGFSHLHVHIVPRMADFVDENKGPKVFVHLSDDEAIWLPEQERDAISERLGAAIASAIN